MRTLPTKAIPFFMLTSVRSGIHILVVLINMRGIEETARKVFKTRIERASQV